MHFYSVPQTEYFAKQCFHSVNADDLYEVYLSDIMKCKFDYKDLEDTLYQKNAPSRSLYRSVQLKHLISSQQIKMCHLTHMIALFLTA